MNRTEISEKSASFRRPKIDPGNMAWMNAKGFGIEPFERWLTESQAAVAVQVDKRTIRQLIESGRLRAVDFGNGKRHHYRIEAQDLKSIEPQTAKLSHDLRPRRRRLARSKVSVAFLPTV